MRKHNARVIEVFLIGAFVAIITVTFWGKISPAIISLVDLSSTKKPTLIEQIKSALKGVNRNSDYVTNRVETVGLLGKLIAQYNNSDPKDPDLLNEIIALMQDLAEADGNTLSSGDAQACVTSPSSCTTLMTVTDFDWSASNPNNTYSDSDGKKPIYGNFNYDVTYLDDEGNLQTMNIAQGVKIQKEHLTNYINQGYTEFEVLSQYMPTAYSDLDFTGSAASVQKKLNSYMDSKDCELSKSESDYVCFSLSSTCTQEEAEDSTGLVVKDYVDND